jgi:hypothetical protein
MRRKSTASSFAVLLSPGLLRAQGPAAPAVGGQGQGTQRGFGRGGPATPANQPFHNERNDARHQGFVEIARTGNVELLFVGDSITDWFANARGQAAATGGEVWKASFGSMKPADFGIAGDTTQGVLWRMQNGELEGFKAKLIALMLGTITSIATRRRNRGWKQADH